MILNESEKKVLDNFKEAGFQGTVYPSMESALKHLGKTDCQRITVAEHIAIYCRIPNTTAMVWCNMGPRVHPVTEEVCLEHLGNGDTFCWNECQCEYSINRLQPLFVGGKLDQARLRAHREWVIRKARAKAERGVVWSDSTRKRFEVPYNETPDRWFRCKNCGQVFPGHAILEGINYRIDNDCGGTAEDLVWIKDRDDLTEMVEE